MQFKTLMGGACAAAMAVASAHAGELDIRVSNVNTLNGDPALDIQMDTNGVDAPLFLDKDTGEVTIDEDGTIVVMERDFSNGKQFKAHYEVEIFDTGLTNTFSGEEQLQVDIFLRGDGNPTFKQTISPGEIVRAGADQIYSEAAEGITNINGNNPFSDSQGRILEGEQRATFLLTPNSSSERSLGFILPVQMETCGDAIAEIQLSNIDTNNVRTGGEVVLASCADDMGISAALVGTDATLAIDTDNSLPYTQFMIADGDSQKGFTTVDEVEIGVIGLKINNYLFNSKIKSDTGANRRDRLFDTNDILSYNIELTFEDISGVAAVNLTQLGNSSPCETFNVTTTSNVVRFELTDGQVRSCFGTGNNPIENGMQTGEVVVSVVLNGLDSVATQHISLTEHSVDFVTFPDTNYPHAMLIPSKVLQDPIDDAVRFVRFGETFGPFDWATENGSQVQSVFRFSGLPADPVKFPTYDGIITVDNSINDVDGYCEFSIPNTATPVGDDPIVRNGEFILVNGRVDTLLNDPTLCKLERGATGDTTRGLADYGRADLSFSFDLIDAHGDLASASERSGIDVDRLLRTNGVYADYGDAANDSNSIKARSCDTGRFGPHVANTLSGAAADYYVDICTSTAVGLAISPEAANFVIDITTP